MSNVTLLSTFVADIQQHGDANFARRVFQKLFDPTGKFRQDANDHRYHGINNAWIRYVSRGTTAFRVIYFREGEKVTIFRAGEHSVEDNLAAPSGAETAIPLTQYNEPASESEKGRALTFTTSYDDPSAVVTGRLICSLKGPTLLQEILSRRLIPHTEVAFVSPFLTHSLLGRNARIGKLIDDFIEDGARVILVTRPPLPADMATFEDLEFRGVELHFCERLHAKLYAFTVDRTKGNSYRSSPKDLYVLGSANLTTSGLCGDRETGNEELSYALPSSDRDGLESFLASMAVNGVDLTHVRIQAARTKR